MTISYFNGLLNRSNDEEIESLYWCLILNESANYIYPARKNSVPNDVYIIIIPEQISEQK